MVFLDGLGEEKKRNRKKEEILMGFFGGSAFEAAEKAASKAQFRRVPEFYLKEGESKEVVFCDDDPQTLHGHKVTIQVRDVRVPRWYTCPQGSSDCVFCERKFTRSWVGPITLLVDQWTEKEGKITRILKWSKRILLAGRETLLKLKLKKESRKKLGEPGLVGCLFSISKISKRNQIDDCEFIKKVRPEDLGVPDFKPLLYEELLAPRSRDEILETMERFVVVDPFAKNKTVMENPPSKAVDTVDY